MHFVEQKYKLQIKTIRNRKWKTPHTVLERQTLCFSSYKNRNLKVKVWWVGARERKKRVFFVPFILSEGNFFKTCVLLQCIVYWIHLQNKNNFLFNWDLLYARLNSHYEARSYKKKKHKKVKAYRNLLRKDPQLKDVS